METILVPTDFSEYATYASDFAAQLAPRLGTELCFIHVVEIPSSPESEYYMSHHLVQNMLVDAEKKLKDISGRYRDLQDVKTFVTTTHALDGIKDGILSMDADLIIMGKHTHSRGLSDLLFDNHTEKIIRSAMCPVLTVSSPVDLSRWQKAVVAIDPEACHEELLQSISSLVGQLGLRPHFVWIAKNPATHTTENIELLKDALHDHLQTDGFDFSSIVSPSIPKGIVQLAAELQADMVVVNTHARKGLNRLVHGSVAESVVEMSGLPTLVIQLEQEPTRKPGS